MKPSFNEKLIAYLTLLSGLSISAVAVYYSVIGLTAIFAAAFIPIIIMGIVLEVGKLVATIWLKQNWTLAPVSVKAYLMVAIFVLMIITSMGIFGFLSKSHADQGLVSGEVISKIALYDEKIKTAKENIETNRKSLRQLDDAVDQLLARSTSEQGADRAVNLRRSQAKERTRLLQEIEIEQKKITALNEERAPIAAQVRKVEAEVGPIKYIAAFVYGQTDPTILEKAVTWVIIILIFVFDPLAIILLLASQISFQNFRERKQLLQESTFEKDLDDAADAFNEVFEEELDNTKLTPDELMGNSPKSKFVNEPIDFDLVPQEPVKKTEVQEENTGWKEATVSINITEEPKTEKDFDINDHPYLNNVPENRHPPGVEPVGPLVAKKDNDLMVDEAIIDQDDYLQVSQEKIDEQVNRYAELIRSGKMRVADVPHYLITEVKKIV